jgi:hypothetical protein
VKPIYFAYLVVALLIFQVFFRYSYIATTDAGTGILWRIDRLTQKTCMIAPVDNIPSLGCRATPEPVSLDEKKPAASDSSAITKKSKDPFAYLDKNDASDPWGINKQRLLKKPGENAGDVDEPATPASGSP